VTNNVTRRTVIIEPDTEFRGIDLIAARKRARVRPAAIADRMGISRQRLAVVESRIDQPVTPEFRGRFELALAELVNEREDDTEQ